MTTEEMLAFVSEVDKQAFQNGILDFSNEYDFSDELLMDLIIAIEYLSIEEMPNAEQMFDRLLKRAEIELTDRLGTLPRRFDSPA